MMTLCSEKGLVCGNNTGSILVWGWLEFSGRVRWKPVGNGNTPSLWLIMCPEVTRCLRYEQMYYFHMLCDFNWLIVDLHIRDYHTLFWESDSKYIHHYGTYDYVTVLGKKLKVKRMTDCMVPFPTDTSTKQFLHLRQRKHHGRVGRKIVRSWTPWHLL